MWDVDESDEGESWRVHSSSGSGISSSSSSSSCSSSSSSNSCSSLVVARDIGFAPENVADVVSTALITSKHDAALIISACRPPEQRVPTERRKKLEERYFSCKNAHISSVSAEAKLLGTLPIQSHMSLSVSKSFTSFGKLNVDFEMHSTWRNLEIPDNYDSQV